MRREYRDADWHLIYTPGDGARIDRLQYRGVDLLTTRPGAFRPPQGDYGLYETRPVYGYDDCFPSVERSPYPGMDWQVPDHGEVCWLEWDAVQHDSGIFFIVKSRKLPLVFKRKIMFMEKELQWHFEVVNHGDKRYPFQHVIHPLIPLDDVTAIALPEFGEAHDAIRDKKLEVENAGELSRFLLEQPAGTAHMLFIREVASDRLSFELRKELRLTMVFPRKFFPTIGIWWNKDGYPDEEGLRRNECAFEPVPGSNSTLADAFGEDKCLYVEPGRSLKWRICWKMEPVDGLPPMAIAEH